MCRLNGMSTLVCWCVHAGESSYSHHNDPVLGLSVVDRFTHATLDFLEGQSMDSKATLADMVKVYT